MRLVFGSNEMVRYKREFVITEFVINELNCICNLTAALCSKISFILSNINPGNSSIRTITELTSLFGVILNVKEHPSYASSDFFFTI